MKNYSTYITTLVLSLLMLSFGLNNAFSQNKKALPPPINTAKFTEYAPSVSADGRTLIFESDRQGDWKLFESHRNGENWSVPTVIPKITTTFFEQAPLGGPCLSYDGNLLLFSANGKDSDGHEDIYYSIREKGGWSSPMNYGKSINTIDYEGYPSLSADGKYLYFARAKYILGDKKDPQQRCYRIMRSERGTDGKWKTALELPSPINLVCEKAPRIMPDGKTLIFSSIRKDGQGNFDVYKSELQENGTWTNPVNLDFLNTSGSDQFVAMPGCGELMYYVMDGDIYTATVPTIEGVVTIQGYITDSTSNNALPAKMTVSEIRNPDKVIAEFESNASDGRFSSVLKPNGKYIFEINEPGFHPKRVVIDLSEKRDCGTYEQNFKLNPLVDKSEDKEMYKLSFLAIDAQTNLTIPASFEATALTTRQPIALQYNSQTLQNQGLFRLKENYSIEASMKGYKNSSLSLRIDDKNQLLPVSIIKLDPISSNFTVKAFDTGTNELLKDTKVKITEIVANQTAEVKANLETGECRTNLLTGKQYKIVVSSNSYEDNEQTITKSDALKELLVKLIPQKVYTANFLAIDLENDEPIDASFIVTSEKTGKVFKGNNVKAKSSFPVPIYKDDNLTIEVIANGFVTARNILPFTNITLGKQDQYKVKLATDRYTLTIKVVDAETQKPIKDAIVKFVDMKTSDVKQATKSKTNDFTAYLKPSGVYELNIKAEDYVELPNQKIDKASDGNVVNFMLSKKKRLPVNFAIFDVATNKPLKASFSVKLEKEQKSFSFKDEIEGTVKVAEREIFTVETSSEGYKPIQSTFNMADFSLNKKYLFPIRLEKALFVLTIKAINKITHEAVTIGVCKITDLTLKTNKPDIIKLPSGDATVSLTPENKYNLEIITEGFEKFEQEIYKLSNNNLVCQLVPKPPESALIFSAIDSTSKRSLDAVFKIIPLKTSILVQGKTSENTPEYKLPLIETDSFKLETFVKGYYIKKEDVVYTTLGKPKKHIVMMSRNFSVLSLKAYDANDNKPIREVFFSLVDALNNKPVAAMITMPNGECSADLKPSREYIIKAKLVGYDDYESRFTAGIDDVNKSVKMRSLKKFNVFLYAIDAHKKNKVSANFKVYDSAKEIIASGKTDIINEQIAVTLTEKSSYIIEITASGYKPYEGAVTPDSSMKSVPIASWLLKDNSMFTFTVLDAQTRKVVDKYVAKLTDVKSRQELVLVKSGDEYSAELSPVGSYMLEIEAQGYAKYITRIEANSELKKNIQLTRTIEPMVARIPTLPTSTMSPKEKLPPFQGKHFEKIEKGKIIILNNVYFEQSSFIIMEKESYRELDKVVLMLKTNPQTKIEIDGHTDNIGDQRLNLALSENRAKVILNYFVSKGIQENRLLYKGYGDAKPVAPNDSEDNKKKNRRVEIVRIQ